MMMLQLQNILHRKRRRGGRSGVHLQHVRSERLGSVFTRGARAAGDAAGRFSQLTDE